jgi:hypothetical protein
VDVYQEKLDTVYLEKLQIANSGNIINGNSAIIGLEINRV